MTFDVKNLYVAAWLHANDYTLIDVKPSGHNLHTFVFYDHNGQCAALEAAYNDGDKVSLSARALFDSLIYVRRALYDVKQGPISR